MRHWNVYDEPIYQRDDHRQGWGTPVSSLRCGCTPDRECRFCNGEADEERELRQATPAERRAFNAQMAAWRAGLDTTTAATGDVA